MLADGRGDHALAHPPLAPARCGLALGRQRDRAALLGGGIKTIAAERGSATLEIGPIEKALFAHVFGAHRGARAYAPLGVGWQATVVRLVHFSQLGERRRSAASRFDSKPTEGAITGCSTM
jgi:hypothetical protein